MPHSTQVPNAKVAIIGGGPAGLMAAEVLSKAGVTVAVYDAMPSVGRKFLMAGVGGMNISNAETLKQFSLRYGSRHTDIAEMLKQFSPSSLRAWCKELGIDTFIGSSGRVFPKDMKAAPLLRAWLHRLRAAGVTFHVRHRWLGWSVSGALNFATASGTREIQADAVVLALGGGSWAKLGSTGTWVPFLIEQGIDVAPLKPSNCGFESNWSAYFADRFAGQPLKSTAASFTNAAGECFQQHGELIVTATGVEGGLIYTLSAPLREEIAASGSATLTLDLLPNQTLPQLITKLSQPKGKQSLANHLRKCLSIDGVKAGLLRESIKAEDFNDPIRLCTLIKALPITLLATRPLDEAISSAGGVKFKAIDNNLMLHSMPGIFCAGEMLDWEAPTGGYLLTACFASGFVAGKGVLDWLGINHS
ncbi:MAG: TIGR03862 family flavoprotein [Methylococcaceae bacterium]|nr:TIGR03862 family flavoprotein [Methylococcaceae bacterium]